MSVKEPYKFNLETLLAPSKIWVAPEGLTKTELIKRLVDTVCADEPKLDGADILAQVLKREEGISTTLDTGLSIPHARLEEITDFKAALAVLPHPMQDPVNPNLSIKAMFLFLSPAKPVFFQRHLQILSALAETFKPEFIDGLLSCGSSEDILARLSAPQ